MSQYGTYGYSLHLKTYDYILGHYYSGTTLGALDANPEVKVLLQGSKKSISFSGGLNAGDQKLDPAQTYTVRRSAPASTCATRPARAWARSPGPCASTPPSASRCA